MSRFQFVTDNSATFERNRQDLWMGEFYGVARGELDFVAVGVR